MKTLSNTLLTIVRLMIFSAIIGAVIGIFSTSGHAQTFTEANPKTGVYDANRGIETDVSITVDGAMFKIFETSNGSSFVKAVSKAGKTYPVWIGTSTGHTHDNRMVYQFKSGSYAIYKLSTNGYPYPVYLKTE